MFKTMHFGSRWLPLLFCTYKYHIFLASTFVSVALSSTDMNIVNILQTVWKYVYGESLLATGLQNLSSHLDKNSRGGGHNQAMTSRGFSKPSRVG